MGFNFAGRWQRLPRSAPPDTFPPLVPGWRSGGRFRPGENRDGPVAGRSITLRCPLFQRRLPPRVPAAGRGGGMAVGAGRWLTGRRPGTRRRRGREASGRGGAITQARAADGRQLSGPASVSPPPSRRCGHTARRRKRWQVDALHWSHRCRETTGGISRNRNGIIA